MGLSYDLISEFAKITNDKKEGPKEGTVYATVVNSTGGKYVKIDGSDLLTPIDTTTGIEDGERVTVMIKDHKATVTGNITSPSVGKGTVNSLVGAVVDENLVGINADIENLIAKNAYLENVFAQNSVIIDSKIENLVAKDTYLENTYAENATIIDSKIENLEATDSRIENSVIENFQVIDGVVQDLKATNADIKVLNADFAQIKTLVNGNLTSDNILSFNLTSEKVTVDDAFIKDAMIDTISAGKINAGKINTNSVSIGSEDGGMLITGSTQQFMDKNGNVRIQIGKDASGDFTFILYGENGQGQIINQNGITASAIGDGLIVNNMVSDNAAISGGKLDISSVITEINSDDSTTIKSSKIYLNEQAQSLEVAFNSLKTKVDTIQEITIEGDLTAIVEQVQSNTSKIEANRDSINTLISQDTVIKKQVTDLQGTVAKTEETLSAKYTSLSQNLDGFKTTVADTYATKSSVTDVVDNIEANYSTTSVMNSAIEQKAQEISASVSSTYATKNQVNTLDNTLRQDYSTTQEMESAINVTKEEINLGVSSIYETKENTTSKIQNAVNNIQVGGTNLWVLLDLKSGYESSGNITSSSIQHKTRQTIIPTNGSKHLVYQCWNPNKVSNTSNTNRVAFFDSNKAYISSTQVLALNGQTYQWQIINIPENTAYVRLGAICGSADKYDTTIKIKFELGNKPTDYSLAPEDVTNDISTAKTEAITSANDTLTTTIANYYTKSQTDSQINVAKEAINLGVSTTYETKENVQTKVTSTLNSAKSYADTKKSEAISTAASDATSKANTAKQEAIASANNTLSSTISNYYTKSQTDSQINVAKEAINLGVSTTYETKADVEVKINNLKIGGNNYLRNTGKSTDYIFLASAYLSYRGLQITRNNSEMKLTVIDNSKEVFYRFMNPEYDKLWGLTAGQTYILSGKIRGSLSGNGSVQVRYQYSPGTHWSADNIIQNTPILQKTSTVYKDFEVLLPIPKEATGVYISFQLYDTTTNDYVEFDKLMLENGTKRSDWSPCPEDITNDITKAKNEAITTSNNTLTSTISNYYTKTQTDSQINIAKEAINLGVSSTYETKTNVESKVTSTLNSAKSYADTKKTEAIAASNNTLTSTISNYYTKTQTDSQINVAKEAINLNVSNTYETKSNVENKVTSTLNSAKSYADTKKTEAISTASADATNKVNGIKIGGTNLLPNTKTLDGDWRKPNQIATDPIDGFTVYHAKGSSSAFIDFSFPNAIEPKPNTYYTLSFMAKGAGSFNSYFYPNTVAKGNNSQGRATDATDGALMSTLSSTYQKYWITWLTKSDVSGLKNIIVSRLPDGTEIYVYGIKLEEGNKATDWSPSPGDVDSKISNIESETISIKESVSSLKLGTDSINASVKSLEESMVNTTNGLSSDISKVQEQVNLAMTSDDVKLEIQKEMSKGASKVSTSTGFTFDQNGLNISKSDSEMKTQITEDGMKIYKNSDIMLTANNQGVDAKNLHATTYLIIGENSRMEDYTEGTSKRTAVFWIG